MAATPRRWSSRAGALLASAAMAIWIGVPVGAQSADQSAAEKAGEKAGKATASAAKPGLRAAGGKPCDCEKLRKYLEMVKKKEQCYKYAYTKNRGMGGGWTTKDQLNDYIQTCMGWTSTYSLGVDAVASEQAQMDAEEKCRSEYCEWICRVAVETVHEPFHNWYHTQVKLNATLLLVYWVAGHSDVVVVENHIVNEIGAHAAETQFLEDTLEELERKGECNRVWKTIDQAEVDFRREQALRRAQKFVESRP